jgi:hypothetical protein
MTHENPTPAGISPQEAEDRESSRTAAWLSASRRLVLSYSAYFLGIVRIAMRITSTPPSASSGSLANHSCT